MVKATQTSPTTPTGPSSGPATRWLGRGWAPTALALGFALLSVPVVAYALTLKPLNADDTWSPIHAGQAVELATVVVLAAALVGGTLGGILVRRHSRTAALVAVSTAWPTAIVLLPAVASALGIYLRAGYFCFDVCNPMLKSADPASGIDAYVAIVAMGFLSVVPAVIAAILLGASLGVAGRQETRRAKIRDATVLLILAYGALHLWSVADATGFAAFACLALGVLIWTILQRPPDSVPPELASEPQSSSP